MDVPSRITSQSNQAAESALSRASHRTYASAALSLSLAELMRAGNRTPDALTAIAARHRQQRDLWAPVFERIAVAVREEGQSLFEAVQRERTAFTPRFVAVLALGNLGGRLFHEFLIRLRQFAQGFQSDPEQETFDFPPMSDELREFCFFFGHLTVERASQPETQYWLPRIFTPKLRLPVTHLLSRFFDQGLLLSNACAKTPPFNDPEVVLAIQAGEELNQVGRELLALATWLPERNALEARLGLNDWILPGLGQSSEAT